MEPLDLDAASFDELDAHKTELYREEQALRERKLAVEAAMQAKLAEHHEAQAAASPVLPTVNSGDGPMVMQFVPAGPVSVVVEGATAAADAGANVMEGGA